MKNFQTARNTRRESRTLVGRFRGGVLAPVMITAVKGNEGGMLSQSIQIELDPIMGRMITPITAELIAVFVPTQAMDVLKNPAQQYAGVTDVVREKLLTGNPLFGLEGENELSKRMGVVPRRISNVLRVNEVCKLGHNCAVNRLRQRKYWKASLLLSTNVAVTPALISQNVLDRFNAVLDPDDRINGAVQLDLPTLQLPVTGIAAVNPGGIATGNANITQGPVATVINNVTTGGTLTVQHNIFATLNGQTAGNVSLSDFYNAERVDGLVRTMDNIVRENPEYGDEMVLRWAHGLNVDPGPVPIIVAERATTFQRNMVGAMDSAGVTAETVRSDFMVGLSFTVPVPRTELGGVIVTFATIKPDETLASQPHPLLSDNWGVDNFVAEELAIDPVPVTMRELNANVPTASENTVAFYTGLNELKRNYVNYGLNRHLSAATISNKTALWQLEIPLSVTPDSVLYPASLSHAPFVDTAAEVATYTVASSFVCQTPMTYGPTPIETLAVIDAQTLLT